MTLVAHSLCADHGELVHGEADHHDEAERDDGRLALSADGESDAHDHCSALSTEDALPSALTVVEPELIAAFDTSADAPPADVALSRKRRLLIAPKTSPPV